MKFHACLRYCTGTPTCQVVSIDGHGGLSQLQLWAKVFSEWGCNFTCSSTISFYRNPLVCRQQVSMCMYIIYVYIYIYVNIYILYLYHMHIHPRVVQNVINPEFGWLPTHDTMTVWWLALVIHKHIYICVTCIYCASVCVCMRMHISYMLYNHPIVLPTLMVKQSQQILGSPTLHRARTMLLFPLPLII